MAAGAASLHGQLHTANDIWRARVRESPAQPAFRFRSSGGTAGWRTATWQDADTAAREIAAGLAAVGIAVSDAVCILLQTRYEWVLCDVGILLAGAVPVPVYASNTAEQCAFIIQDAGVKAVFAEDTAQVEKLAAVRARMPGLLVIQIVDGSPALGSTHTLAQIRELGRAQLKEPAGAATLDGRTASAKPGDLFTIIYTSGTTGNPKGARLTHGNLVSACFSAIRALEIFPTDEQYLFLPLAHVLGREMEWALIAVGAITAFSEGLTKIKDNLAEVRPTLMAGVPRIFEKFFAAVQAGLKVGSPVKKALVAWAFGVGSRRAAAVRAGLPPGAFLRVQHALADKLVLSKLRAKLGLDRCRFLISGGAPLAAEIAEFFHAAGLLILEGYGLTETMAAAFLNRPGRFRFGTVGPALDVVESRIADDGEILMRGPSIFAGYHNNPAATAEAIDAEGWFHSGDIGHIEDGFLRITDRKKDIIVTAGGKKIAPQILENTLKMRCPLLSQIVVLGDNRPFCIALVTLSEDAAKRFGGGDCAAAARSPELRGAIAKEVDALNASLPSYESVKKFAILPAEFTEVSGELTPSMKVKRKVVTERYAGIIEGLYNS